MAFDIGAGLAEAGKSVAQTAQAYTLESQKAELEQEKIKLADQLAGAREEKNRAFVTSEREATQKFTGAENDKSRANALAVANIGLEGHRVSAGATVAAAQIGAAERRHATDKNFELQKYSIDEQIKAQVTGATRMQIGDNGEAFSVNPITKEVVPLKDQDGKPLKFRDPDVAKAQSELIKTKTDQVAALNRIYVPQIIDLENNIAKLSASPTAQFDTGIKTQIADYQSRLKTIRDQFDSERAPLIRDLNSYAEALITKGRLVQVPDAGASTNGRPALSAFDRSPAGVQQVEPVQVEKPKSLKMPGLINSPYSDGGNY